MEAVIKDSAEMNKSPNIVGRPFLAHLAGISRDQSEGGFCIAVAWIGVI